MIYLEIFGREKDGITDAAKTIITSILARPDTKQLILIDETSSIIYELGLDEFRMGSTSTKSQFKQMIFNKYPEKVIYVVPHLSFNISDFMQETVITQFRKNKDKVYCIYYRVLL